MVDIDQGFPNRERSRNKHASEPASLNRTKLELQEASFVIEKQGRPVDHTSKIRKGFKGTIYVPEDRANHRSRIIELPIVVIISDNPSPLPPIFQFEGGPGLTNINYEKNVNESILENHHVVQIGYRGIDGSPTLKHPLLDNILLTPNTLSRESLRQIGGKATKAASDLRADGIDVSNYNILNVVEDVEDARITLNKMLGGFEKIIITGGSYGGAVVTAYSLMYPEIIERAIMAEGAFPYDIAFGSPEGVDAKLARLNDVFHQYDKNAPDLMKVMRVVFENMPSDFKGMPIDPDKVRLTTFFGLYERKYVSMLFEAFISAEKGDYSSIAVMSPMYDYLMTTMFQCVGDLLAKTWSSVTDPKRDFLAELENEKSIIGSPLAKACWGSFQFSDWSVKSFSKEHPLEETTDVPAMIIYGSKEQAEPTREKYGNIFTNGEWVVLNDLGHSDIWEIPEASAFMHHLYKSYLDEGFVESPKIKTPEWIFKPPFTFFQMFQQMMSKQ